MFDVEMHGYTARTCALAERRRKVLAYHILIATHTATHIATHTATHIATRTATCTATLRRCIDVARGRVYSDGYAKEPSPAIFLLQHTLQHNTTHCNTLQYTLQHALQYTLATHTATHTAAHWESVDVLRRRAGL